MLWLAFTLAGSLSAQLTLPNAVPAPSPEIQYLDANGAPLAGASLCTYAAGTSTPLATYTSSTAGTPNTNPIILDSAGRASVWVGPRLYKFVLRTGDDGSCTTGSIVWTQDNVADTTLYFANFVKTAGTATIISYTAPVTGAIQRTVSARLSDIISAKDFGVLCDGSTDDTTAMRTAITQAASAGVALLIPSGTCILSPSSEYILPLLSNSEIRGEGTATILKVKDNTGAYKSFFGPYGNIVSNFSIRDFTVDQNTQNNVVPNSGYLSTHFRLVVGTGTGGDKMTIDHVNVTNTEGINTFYFGTPHTSVTNCVIDKIGLSSVSHDYSAIYAAAESVVIANNQFLASAVAALGAVTAIETHGGNQTITGNVVNGMLTGMNITGIAPVDSVSISVSGNSIKNTAFGIFVWSFQGSGHTTGYGVDSISITGNSIRLAQNSFSGIGGNTGGIVLYPVVGVAALPYVNVNITGNSVEFDYPSAYDNTASIGIGYWDASGGGRVSGMVIADNTIINAPVIGIRFSANGDNIVISGNNIANPGCSTGSVISAFRTGVFLANSSPIKSLRVVNNTISDTQATSTMGYGIEFATVNTADLHSIGNIISWTEDSSSYVCGVCAIDSFQKPFLQDTVYAPGQATIVPGAAAAFGSVLTQSDTGLRYSVKASLIEWQITKRGAVAPTGGAWNIGDIVWNDTPTEGSAIAGTQTIMGWLNVISGTPGTWIPFAAANFDKDQYVGAVGAAANATLYIHQGSGQATPPLIIYKTDGSPGSYFDIADTALHPQASNAGIYSGVGSPEGVVTAAQGAIYLNQGGGSHTSLYVKETGAGNTGWVGK